MSVTVSEFKAACATLGRFADIRETAKEPRDRIIVQASQGRLKLIAGDDDSTVVVDLGETEETGKCVVKARLLLSSAKALRGRGEVDLTVSRDGVTLRASAGGQVRLNSISAVMPELVRPPKKSEALHVGTHDGFGLASKVMPVVTSKNHPANLVYLRAEPGELSLTGCNSMAFGSWSVPLGTKDGGWDVGAVSAKLFGSLADLTEPGPIAWDETRVAIRSGRFLVGSRLQPIQNPFRPVPAVPAEAVVATVDRKLLIEALRGVASGDANERVRARASGSTLVLEGWDGAGTMTLPATFAGRTTGKVGFSADRMKRLAMALPGKTITVRFAGDIQTKPIGLSSEEATGWQMLLAPVV